jgi:hypothetical protein
MPGASRAGLPRNRPEMAVIREPRIEPLPTISCFEWEGRVSLAVRRRPDGMQIIGSWRRPGQPGAPPERAACRPPFLRNRSPSTGEADQSSSHSKGGYSTDIQ